LRLLRSKTIFCCGWVFTEAMNSTLPIKMQ
jgi:hypothetical protein